MGRRDEQDDDLGFRTPTRRERSEGTSRRKRDAEVPRGEPGKAKRETGKTKRETGKHKRETGKHKRETGKHKRETGKHAAAAAIGAPVDPPAAAERVSADKAPPQAPGRKSGGLKPGMLVAGVAVALIAGGGLYALMAPGAPTRPTLEVPIAEAPAVEAPVEVQTSAPGATEPARRVVPDPKPLAELPKPKPEQAAVEPVAPEDALAALAAKSSTHAAVARVLEAYAELFDPAALRNPGPMFEDFHDRQQREEAMLAEVRAMGPVAVGALKDMLLGLEEQRQYRIFLSKALAGMEGPEALKAVSDILGTVKDVAVQTTLVRFLPEGRESADAVGAAIGQEENPTLRTMLLREYHRRLGDDLAAGGDIFRRAALEDPDPNVRAEAVTILGRRGDPHDQALMEQIIADETNLQIRQRAIVSYAETGRDSSLDFLDRVVRDRETALAIRASAVLAMGRVGGGRAVAMLDQIAQSDPHQEIRTRAQRLAASLRRRMQEAANPPDERVDEDPLRVSPPGPLEKQ